MNNLKKKMKRCFIATGITYLIMLAIMFIILRIWHNQALALLPCVLIYVPLEMGLYFYVRILHERKLKRWFFFVTLMILLAIIAIWLTGYLLSIVLSV